MDGFKGNSVLITNNDILGFWRENQKLDFAAENSDVYIKPQHGDWQWIYDRFMMYVTMIIARFMTRLIYLWEGEHKPTCNFLCGDKNMTLGATLIDLYDKI